MKTNNIVIECEYDLAELMYKNLEKCSELQCVCCIGTYETIKELITSLILLGEGEIGLVDASLEEELDEDRKYLLTLDDFGIWVMPYDNDGYWTDYLYVDGRFNSKILLNNAEENAEVTSYDYCSGECEDCPYLEDEFNEEDCEDIWESLYHASDIDECEDCKCSECSECYDEEELYSFSISKSTDEGTTNYSFYETSKNTRHFSDGMNCRILNTFTR